MTKIISIANHKGGVGKTTTTVNLAAGLNKMNKKVLCVDLDPQANLTQSLGLQNYESSIYDSLTQNSDIIVYQIIKGFDIVPSQINLSGAELELMHEPGRESILKNLLNPLMNDYDYILIDCPPSLGLLTINALTASGYIIIPLQAQFLAAQGMTNLFEIIRKIQERINPDLKIGGIVLTQFNGRKILNKDIAKSVYKFYSNALFNTRIRDNISIAEAPTVGLDIFRYNDKSLGAEDYANLTIELINRF